MRRYFPKRTAAPSEPIVLLEPSIYMNCSQVYCNLTSDLCNSLESGTRQDLYFFSCIKTIIHNLLKVVSSSSFILWGNSRWIRAMVLQSVDTSLQILVICRMTRNRLSLSYLIFACFPVLCNKWTMVMLPTSVSFLSLLYCSVLCVCFFIYTVIKVLGMWKKMLQGNNNAIKNIGSNDWLQIYSAAEKLPQDLWLVLQEVWNNLPVKFLQKLCTSVPRRIDAVLKAKGGHTK